MSNFENFEIKPIPESESSSINKRKQSTLKSEKLPDIHVKHYNPNDLIAYTLKVREKLEQLRAEKKGKEQLAEDKSIGRNRRTIQTQSMSIESWLESKKRQKQGHIKKNNNEKDAIDIVARYNIEDNQFFNDLLENNATNKTATSYRELRNLALLDKIDTRLKNELHTAIRKIIRHKSQQEFNLIAEKMKSFLDELERAGLLKMDDKPVKFYQFI